LDYYFQLVISKSSSHIASATTTSSSTKTNIGCHDPSNEQSHGIVDEHHNHQKCADPHHGNIESKVDNGDRGHGVDDEDDGPFAGSLETRAALVGFSR
jgi:hypothetical protein